MNDKKKDFSVIHISVFIIFCSYSFGESNYSKNLAKEDWARISLFGINEHNF